MSLAIDPGRRLEAAFHADRALLFALCYRLTGTDDDAEEIVQETFARALAPALLILLGAPLPAVAAASGLFLAFATLNHANLPARALGLQRPRAARSEAGEVA